jgi:glycosyltransferase involved in cell wall biosynthesis
MSLSVAIITKNEEANIRRTLESVKWADEIVVVDSGSTDRTCEIARECGAKVFVEEWKGFAKQKNSALEKCTSDWILSLDADEEVSLEAAVDIRKALEWKLIDAERMGTEEIAEVEQHDGKIMHDVTYPQPSAFDISRKNFFLGRQIRFGGFYPDRKIRLLRRSTGALEERMVHEDLKLFDDGNVGELRGHLIHHAYPTLSGYIEHMNRYSDLGGEMVVETKGKVGFSLTNIVIRPVATFIYNYFFRLGFLDGKEGLLLHLYHSVYVSWKYAKAWELSRQKK